MALTAIGVVIWAMADARSVERAFTDIGLAAGATSTWVHVDLWSAWPQLLATYLVIGVCPGVGILSLWRRQRTREDSGGRARDAAI